MKLLLAGAFALLACAPSRSRVEIPPPPAPATELQVEYRWSGGLSIYRSWSLRIDGNELGTAFFDVETLRNGKKSASGNLSAEEMAELRAAFEKAGFDTLKTRPREFRASDMGQTVISRTIGGAKKELVFNGSVEPDGDIKPLRDWLDRRVQQYLEKSGAKPHEH